MLSINPNNLANTPAAPTWGDRLYRYASGAGSVAAWPFKKIRSAIKWGWNGSGSLISNGWEKAGDMFSSSKPYYESSAISGAGFSKKVLYVAGGVVAAGLAMIGIGKLIKASGNGHDVEDIRDAALVNELNRLQIQEAGNQPGMYRNQGNWANAVGQPTPTYQQQAALDQQSQQSITLQK